MKLRSLFTLCALTLVIAACGDDDAATTTTTAATTTTTTTIVISTTTTVPDTTTTTVPETTTTTLGTGPLADHFDGSTPAVPGYGAPDMGFDLSTTGFLTVSNPGHPSPGSGMSYYATYPHLLRDGILTMRFRPGDPADDARYTIFLWASVDLAAHTEVMVTGNGTTVVSGIAPETPPTQTVLTAPEGTFDPAGFNELRVEAFDGNLNVFLNGVALGEVIDPADLHEGVFGFSLIAFVAGSEMTVDEFTAQPEIS